MKVGVFLPVSGRAAGRKTLMQAAQQAEALGYDSVWGNDHLTTQRYVRREFTQPGANTIGIRRQIKRPERTHFAVAGEARVGLDPYDGAVENGDRFAAGPFVAALVQR